MATAVKVSLEEYLNTSYHPDVEYLDGELKEKSVVDFPHGEAQGFIFRWFSEHYEEWNIRCAVETRTQVSAKHVRLPDIVVIQPGDRRRGALLKPPIIAIEVLSPSDTYNDLKLRAADLEQMGVPNIWLIDENARTCEVWRNGSWQMEKTNQAQAIDSPIYLDLDWLWTKLN